MAFLSDPFAAAASGFGSILGFIGNERTNQMNAEMAQRQMDFQERLSNTAHQREVQDLLKAGLNPILSATKGASTPGGASATMTNSWDHLAKAPEAILALEKLRADISRTRAETAVSEATKENVLEQNKKLQAENKMLGLDARIRDANLYKMEQDARIENTWYGRNILAPIRTTLGAVGNIFGRVPEYMPKTVKGR